MNKIVEKILVYGLVYPYNFLNIIYLCFMYGTGLISIVANIHNNKELRKIRFEIYEKQYLRRLEKPKNKCPRCHEENTMTVVRKDGGKLKCEKCSYLCTDDETDVLFGLVKVVSPDKTSYENMGGNWEKYPSWYCLKFFETYEERVAHDKKYHENDTVQLGMFPVGFSANQPANCD